MEIKRHLEFIKIQFIIAFKKLIEYKTNMYFLFVEHAIFSLAFIYMYSIIFDNFKEMMPWTLNDFIIFFIIHDYLIILAGIFYWGKSLFHEINNGTFNNYLTRPINIFTNYFFNDMTHEALVFLIGNTLFNIVIIIIFGIKVNLFNLIYMLPGFILLLVLFLLITNAVFSLDFKFRGIGKYIYRFYADSNNVIRYYPPHFFNKIKYKITLIIFSSYFTGVILMPLIQGVSYLELKFEIILTLIFIFILTIIIYLNWQFGLEKYEAFG